MSRCTTWWVEGRVEGQGGDVANVCVSVWIRGVAESEKGGKKKKKSAIPLNDNLSELFFSGSSSFITLSTPPTPRLVPHIPHRDIQFLQPTR